MGSIRGVIGQVIKLQFAVFDIDGLTPLSGLTNSDFTKTVLRDTVNETLLVPLTVTEVGTTARYVASFTPNAGGFWYVDALVIPTDDLFAEHVEVTGVSAETSDRIRDVWQLLGLDPDNPVCISKTQQITGAITLKHTEVGDALRLTRET